MPRWLRQFLDKHFTRIIYSPEVDALGPVGDREWPGLLSDLAEGYERHKPIFRAIQILLRQTERAMLRVQVPKTADEMALNDAELRGLVREANAYRRILRLPIESQKLRAKKLAAEEAMKQEPEPEPDTLD